MKAFIDVYSRRDTGFHRRTKRFDLILITRKTSARWSNQVSKIVLIAGQFAQCPALMKPLNEARKAFT